MQTIVVIYNSDSVFENDHEIIAQRIDVILKLN